MQRHGGGLQSRWLMDFAVPSYDKDSPDVYVLLQME